MPKVKKTVTLDRELVEWCETEIKTKRFASLSHAIEYCICKMMSESRGEAIEDSSNKAAKHMSRQIQTTKEA